MTMVLNFKPNAAPAAKAKVEALHRALSEVLAGGFVDHVAIDGVPHIMLSGSTPHGHSSFHPTDPSQDKHTPHDAGRAPEDYTYTLVAK